MSKHLTVTRVIIWLLVVTTVMLVGNQLIPERRMLIDATTAFEVSVIDDRARGGLSQASLKRDRGAFILGCQIIKSDYQWPFCEINVDFRENLEQGIDLSAMERVELSAHYDKESKLGIRFQLRNYSPDYSTPDDKESLKYVALEYFKHSAGNEITFPLQSLQVPTWWLVEKALPVEQMVPAVDNIHHLEIATGNGITPGYYELRIEQVAFVGKYISQEILYLSLLILWIVAAVGYLSKRVFDQQRQLKQAKNRRKELEAVNRLLDFRRKELEEKMDKDPLTGALNRDGIYKIFTADCDVSAQATLSVMFFDLDKFKSINDNYGHGVGDEVLVIFSALVRSSTRDSDILARWGGEEFILACPNTSLHKARTVAEGLCQKIREKKWPQDIPVTCSVGVAEMGNESIENLIDRADKALYEAKNTGRDKVVVSEG